MGYEAAEQEYLSPVYDDTVYCDICDEPANDGHYELSGKNIGVCCIESYLEEVFVR